MTTLQMLEIVHIVDDDPAVRESLSMLLDARGYATRTHASSEVFLRDFSAENALCVLADLRMPGMGGLELQTELHKKNFDVPFIMITGHGDVPSAVQALKSGAIDFIEKPVRRDVLLAALDKVAASRRSALAAARAAAAAHARIAALTPRERDILRHVVKGEPNKIIAYELGISPRTVENHRARLMVKMGAGSVADLVHAAIAGGLPPGEPGNPAT